MEKEFVCARHEKIWNDYLSELAKNTHLFFHLRFFLNDFLAIPSFSSYFCKRNHIGGTRHKKRRKVCQERLTE